MKRVLVCHLKISSAGGLHQSVAIPYEAGLGLSPGIGSSDFFFRSGVAIPYEAGLGLSPTVGWSSPTLGLGVAIPYEAGLGLSHGGAVTPVGATPSRNPL